MAVNAVPTYLIDASIYIFRYYFSLPENWYSRSGLATAAVYGYGRWLLKFLEEVNPLQVAVCFDESLGSCFRNEIYPDYKCSRALPDEALAFQLTACRELTELMGVATYASARFEADDLLATLAQRCQARDQPVCIVSRDKDLAQIVTQPHDTLWDFPEGAQLTRNTIFQKFGVAPEQVATYLALVGDVGDDIPGVPRLGPKTAAALLQHYSDWPDLKNHLADVAQLNIRGAKTLAAKLEQYSLQIDVALRLATVFRKAPLERRLRLTRARVVLPELHAYCNELGLGAGFNTSVSRILG